MQSEGLKLKKAFKIHGHEYLEVKDTLTMLLGDSSRPLKGALTIAMPYYTLGDASLKRTVIDLEDWTMTFRSGKGDIKLPLLKG